MPSPLTSSALERIAPKLRLIQIISAAILMGALIFTVLICITVDWNAVTGEIKLLTLIGAVTGLMMYGMSMIVPKLTTASPTQIAAELASAGDSKKLADDSILAVLIQNKTVNGILHFAIIEGAIFLNLITFKLESSSAALVMVVIGLFMLLIAFPFPFRVRGWLERNLQLVNDELKLMR